MAKKAQKKRPYKVLWTGTGHPLALALQKKGITQRQLAGMAGVQPADISRVLNGERERFAAGTAAKIYPHVKGWKVKMEDLIMPFSHGA
jgi:transcriptional regulator with XRE-family HTH domain